MTETGSAWLTASWTNEGLTIAVGGLFARLVEPDPPAPPATAESAPALETAAQPSEPFTIEERWPEMVTYWEGDQGFMFFGLWGVTPHILMVPSASCWDEVMPEWLQGRRDVVIARLVEHTGDLIDDDHDNFYRVAPDSRLQRR